MLPKSPSLRDTLEPDPLNISTGLSLLLKHHRSLWTGVGKSGYAARLLAATAATSGLVAAHVHAEDLLHGELSTLQESDVLVAISWSARSEQIGELIARAPSATALITSASSPRLSLTPDYVILCRPVSDVLLDGIPSESILETLQVGYGLIAAATTPSERRLSLRAGHPHGALAYSPGCTWGLPDDHEGREINPLCSITKHQPSDGASAGPSSCWER
jgi:D-arabinose 5-phosphate isomerase GutQ